MTRTGDDTYETKWEIELSNGQVMKGEESNKRK